MVDANKIIEDIIKGAQSTEGFVRGSTVGVERQVLGEETKLAGSHPGLGAAVIPGPIGAALGAESGHRSDAFLGSAGGGTAGGVAGASAGALIAALTRNPEMAPLLMKQLGGLGAYGGSIAGASEFGQSHTDKLLGKHGALQDSYADGAQAACDQYKVAFIPALMAGIAGAGKLIKGGIGLGKKLLGSKAGKAVTTGAMIMPRGGGGGGGGAPPPGGGRMAPGGGGGAARF